MVRGGVSHRRVSAGPASLRLGLKGRRSGKPREEFIQRSIETREIVIMDVVAGPRHIDPSDAAVAATLSSAVAADRKSDFAPRISSVGACSASTYGHRSMIVSVSADRPRLGDAERVVAPGYPPVVALLQRMHDPRSQRLGRNVRSDASPEGGRIAPIREP